MPMLMIRRYARFRHDDAAADALMMELPLRQYFSPPTALAL